MEKVYDSPSKVQRHFALQSELEKLTRAREAETKYVREQNKLEITKAREMATIESEKFINMVQAIGSDTISAIATSSPEIQVALHMRAYRTFKNVKGVTSKNGEEWLIKMADTEAHILDVYEEVKLLQSLGLRSTLITDGSKPVNLFTTYNSRPARKNFIHIYIFKTGGFSLNCS